MFPVILLCVNHSALWNIPGSSETVVKSLYWFAIGGYSLKLAYLLVLSYGLFRNFGKYVFGKTAAAGSRTD